MFSALKEQQALSPGQSRTAPQEYNECIAVALKGQKRGCIEPQTIIIPYHMPEYIKAFALAGRHVACADNTRGAAPLCPGLCSCRPCRAQTPERTFSKQTFHLTPSHARVDLQIRPNVRLEELSLDTPSYKRMTLANCIICKLTLVLHHSKFQMRHEYGHQVI